MFSGIVYFSARFKQHTLIFKRTAFVPQGFPGVKEVTIKASGVRRLRGAVELLVPSPTIGQSLASEVTRLVLDRIAFLHQVAFDGVRFRPGLFTCINAPAGEVDIEGVKADESPGNNSTTRNVSSENLKHELERPQSPRDRYFYQYASARSSPNEVEEFLRLYQILLQIYGDNQDSVDEFITSFDPKVPKSPKPRRPKQRTQKPNNDETIYTRLRNEFSHHRNVDIKTTRTEMIGEIGNMRTLVSRAIQNVP